MPKTKGQRIIPYPIESVYNVVMDIEKYPDVLHFINDVNIIEKDGNTTFARVRVGLPPLNFTYECKIICISNQSVEVTDTKGPFKKLYALWEFKESDKQTTIVDYQLDSEFKSKLMEITGGSIFAQQLHYSMKAFERYLKHYS